MVGDYTRSSHKIPPTLRKQMVLLIEEMHGEDYFTKMETLYQAVYIADKYLIEVIKEDAKPPCLIELATTSIFVAAKI